MPGHYLRYISDCETLDRLGSKGRNIQRLIRNEFPTPVTYCLTTDAYLDFVAQSDIQEKLHKTIRNQFISAQEKSSKIRELIKNTIIPTAIYSELAGNEFLKKDGKRWAVRSSGNLKDLSSSTFAGVYDSFLHIEGINGIVEAIKRCWASLWNERAILYRTRNHFEHEQASMAVLIQEMVDPEFSGMIFTKLPDSQSTSEIFLEYCGGLCESLVSRRITPFSCVINRLNGRITHLYEPSGKKFRDTDIRNLLMLALEIEKCFGGPQDIEWAFKDGRFYVLQTRPIVAKVNDGFESEDVVWTRANVGEVLPKPVTPLTWQIFRATLLNSPELIWGLPKNDKAETDSRGIKLIRGLVYVRTDSFMSSFGYLPYVTPETMSHILGVETMMKGEKYPKPKGILVRLAQSAFILEALGLIPRISWMVRYLPPLPRTESEQLERIINWTSRCFQLHLKCTAYSIGAFALLSKILNQWLPEHTNNALPLIFSGHENFQTAAQGISLVHLAEYAWKNKDVQGTIEKGMCWPRIREELEKIEGGPQFVMLLDSFLEKNGARAAEELELAIPRWRENPTFLITIIRKLAKEKAVESLQHDLIKHHQHREESIRIIKKCLPPFQYWIFSNLLASYRRFVAQRENVKYRLIEGFAAIREIYLEEERVLIQKGLLGNPGDIFFLTPPEINSLKKGDMTRDRAGRTIHERKEQHAQWETETSPEIFREDGINVLGENGKELIGIGCSPGIVEGVARVLMDICDSATLRPGEILVALHTDPGWTPLFLHCRAIVTELGGFLSHGATVAREYGIPAVVGVTGATSKIRTGDLLRVDGTAGIIVIQQKTSS